MKVITDAELGAEREAAEGGLGTLSTERGNLPLESVDAAVRITGLVGRIELTQGFHNPYDAPLEATYIFPLPDRAAVTAMTLTADDRTVRATLRERGAAREAYDQAVAEGRRAAIAEEERPDVFTMRVGNILPGERVSVALTLVGPLSYEDGEATFRLPLVVAPRYIPGAPTGSTVGDGYAPDTDAVPDASRITPPVLLPGFGNPVRLRIGVDVDPAGLPLAGVRSSLHAITGEGGHLEIQAGERLNRDFVLRLAYGEPDAAAHALTLTPDAEGDEGTFRLTILPPTTAAPPRPRDVVLVLDRSGSMSGWKMVAARRAAARIVDTLTAADRFAVLAFDDRVEWPAGLGEGLRSATDHDRFTAVGYLSTVDARGGTELLEPLTRALGLLTDATRDRVVVLVTDGQVGNEDHLLRRVTPALAGIRVHTVGIDQAVNAGFLGRLAGVGGGRCELVESADRLDVAMEHIHRRVGAPVVTGLTLIHESVDVLADTVSPARLPDLFPGAPLVVTGRYRGAADPSAAPAAAATPAAPAPAAPAAPAVPAAAAVTVTGRTRPGDAWSALATAVVVPEPSSTALWARAHLRDLEDRYASVVDGRAELESRIVTASERFGVLCRFTAWVAIDERVVVTDGVPHRVVQPVETPAGWDMFAADEVAQPMMLAAAAYQPMAAPVAPVSTVGAARLLRAVSPDAARRAGSPPRPSPSLMAPGAKRKAAPAEASSAMEPVRVQAAAEAARLRAAAGAPDYERWELLADLGTRLDALARELAELGAAPELVSRVRDCAAGLAADPGQAPGLTARWATALALLDELAVPFWKR